MKELNGKQYLSHALQSVYEEIKTFKKKKSFLASSLYASNQVDINKVIDGLEWDNTLSAAAPKEKLRIISWNIERGKQLDGIISYFKENKELSSADIILAVECDNGMGRTDNRNVAKELAEALGMNYCFAPSYLVLGKGAIGETSHSTKNTTALHGTAILSKYPISLGGGIKVPPVKEVFHSSEKRLGCKKGLAAQVQVGDLKIGLGAIHIDLSSTAQDRSDQLETLVKEIPASDIMLVGGDWNTSTFQLRNKGELAWQVISKFFTVKFKGAIEHYMTPELKFDKPIFDMLQRYNYAFDHYNDRSKGTIYFDINDLLSNEKAKKFVPPILLKDLERRLRPWGGCVPLKIDWFAGKGGTVKTVGTIERPSHDGVLLSDHNPIYLDLAINS
jgi:endonuclease/exonuclease/phosphatase family metal-dependent hydrolase